MNTCLCLRFSDGRYREYWKNEENLSEPWILQTNHLRGKAFWCQEDKLCLTHRSWDLLKEHLPWIVLPFLRRHGYHHAIQHYKDRWHVTPAGPTSYSYVSLAIIISRSIVIWVYISIFEMNSENVYIVRSHRKFWRNFGTALLEAVKTRSINRQTKHTGNDYI